MSTTARRAATAVIALTTSSQGTAMGAKIDQRIAAPAQVEGWASFDQESFNGYVNDLVIRFRRSISDMVSSSTSIRTTAVFVSVDPVESS